ncbi:hypothetical protein [Actinomycetospora sp.]|uniref:hypothetical protein n=1 Tax=Actinomycetospora sp. TaxID=1872135 RepID=UPI002F404E11
MAAGQCSRCGATRTDGWAFCRACGAVDLPAPRPAVDDEAPAAAREHQRVSAGRGAVPTGPEAVPAAHEAVPADRAVPPRRTPPVSRTGPRPTPRPPSRRTPAGGPARARVPVRGDGPPRRTPGGGTARAPVPLIGTPRDWLGALAAAAATLAVLAVPGALLAVVAGSESPAASPLMLVPVAIALGVGGSVSVQLDLGTLGGLDSVVAGTPLLVTAVAVATGASLVVGDARPAADVPVQAARSVVAFLAGLTAVALTGRVATTGGAITVAVAPTLLGGALWFAGALALVTAWRRPDVLAPGLRRMRDVLAGPVAGAGAVLGSCWLGGLALVVAGVLARAATGTPVEPTTWLPPGVTGAVTSSGSGSATAGVVAVAAVVMFAPTALLGAFAFCLGVPLVGRGPTGERVLGLVHLLGDGPSWWLAPLVGALICVLGGMAAALHAPSPEEALRRGWTLGPALAAALALVAVVTELSAGPLGVRLDLAPAVVLGLGWGAVGGLLGAVIAPGLPPALRQGRLGESATGQVVGVLVVVGFLGAALVIGFAAAAGTG